MTGNQPSIRIKYRSISIWGKQQLSVPLWKCQIDAARNGTLRRELATTDYRLRLLALASRYALNASMMELAWIARPPSCLTR